MKDKPQVINVIIFEIQSANLKNKENLCFVWYDFYKLIELDLKYN
jgi:hypothetical protein